MTMKTMQNMNMLDPFGKGFLPGQVHSPVAGIHHSRPVKTKYQPPSHGTIHHSESDKQDSSK